MHVEMVDVDSMFRYTDDNGATAIWKVVGEGNEEHPNSVCCQNTFMETDTMYLLLTDVCWLLDKYTNV